MRLIDADELGVCSIDHTDIPTDKGLMVYMADDIAEAHTIKAIPIEDLISTIDIGITATGNSDVYSAGMCNGLIWLKTCYTHEEPNYVEAKQKSIPIDVLEELKAELLSAKGKWWYGVENDCFMKLSDVLQIIDKYKAESKAESEEV